MSKYSEKLKSPKWQKKRLQILERDNWRCQGCGNKQDTLNVHHMWYTNGKEPWEYDDECYVTLCDECHSSEHNSRKLYEDSLIEELRQKQFMADDVQNILIAIHCMNERSNRDDVIRAFEKLLEDPSLVNLVLNVYVGRREILRRGIEEAEYDLTREGENE